MPGAWPITFSIACAARSCNGPPYVDQVDAGRLGIAAGPDRARDDIATRVSRGLGFIELAAVDEVAAELGRTLDFAKVPAREKGEVLAAFAAHKNEVTAGSKGMK